MAALNATFLLALILIASPVAGLRPIRAARFLTCKIPRPAIRIRSPFEVLGDKADEIAEKGFTCPFRQMMLLGQHGSKMLERNDTLGLGRIG